ncbi:MAG: twin-arginine translocation signal domain-containing protein, partial [Desulfovibrionaceae bacterium]|nr:twin-arginine translocation signal domain-containing protein [Desulfovibrionaceae bacterium]
MKLNLTRRAFLKRSSIAAAAFSLSDHLSPSFVSSATSGSQSNTEIIPTVCGLCKARCLVEGVIRNGRLHHIQGNGKSPFNGTKVCARGLAAVKLLYDPDRLKYPLKRSGRRGEGRWTRI